jgi:HMG (high mobility group) box
MAQNLNRDEQEALFSAWRALSAQLLTGAPLELPQDTPPRITAALGEQLAMSLDPVTVNRGSKKGIFKPAAEENRKVPRPPNVWILFRQHHHSKVKAENPSLTNNDICK